MYHAHDPGPHGERRHHHPRDWSATGGWARDRGTPGRPRGPHHGGRAMRGDVRTAVLQLLAEQPMHGYQLMQAISERSGGRWTPSPGAIYPTISQLEDEGLVTVTADAGRKLVTLTDAGREQAAARGSSWADPFAAFGEPGAGADLRNPLEQLHAAVRQIMRSGTEAQVTAATDILTDARRRLYLLLADGPEATDA